MADDTSVRVAVRIRPQLAREKIDNCRVCTSVTPGEPQVVMGNDKAFTFDTVFDTHAGQQEVFEAHAKQLIDGCFDGYNATILAYGQTGSGKTHSMGTGFDVSILEEDMGIIPRAVRHLFTGIMSSKIKAKENTLPEPTFHVYAEFLELYNEDIYDLFDNTNGEGKRSKSNIKIHEDSNGSIYTQGVTLKTVNSYEETMECLQFGALSRTTASTNMNSQSSRSHAIFTLHVKQTRALPQTNMTESTEGEKEVDTSTVEFESLSSKFNFVDLAGSERLKRTGATGDRAKEGISINCGLLALGNVISALGDVCKKGSHVPYRDSKLTRLLQDSLGGNSRTVMIACISPSDRDFMETLNTLKYANRARNIKNRVVVNQDKTSKQLTELRAQVQALQLELVEYKQGKRIVGPDGVESINDMFHENSLLQDENDKLRHRVKVLQETVDHMKSTNESAANDRAAVILSSVSGDNNLNEEVKKLISGYNTELESLRVKLLESEAANKHVKRTTAPPSRLALTPSTPRSMMDTPSEMDGSLDSTVSIIELAKQDVERSKTLLFTKQQSMNGSFPDENTASGGDDSAEADSGEHEADDDLDQSDDDQSESEHSSESDDQSSKGLIYKLPELTEAERIEEDLADLSGEISIKQKMIEELEKSQRQLQTIRQHYEDKLRNLQQQIRDIERERDQVLNTIGDKSKQSEEQVKKVKSEFEKRLSDMQAELSKVSAAKREHSKMMKNQAVYDKKIRELNSELSDMKKTKVRLMSQMKTESEKNKISDQKKNRELLQLRKEKRMRDSQLKQLEMQNRQKDAILKRKHEEVSQLRRKQRETSASARVMAKNRVNSTQRNGSPRVSRGKATPAFSAKVAKSKWDKLEHYISSVIMRKQTITSMESEMDLFIDKREGLSKKIERYTHKLETAMQVDDIELATDLEDQLETMNINMNYIQSNVAECQNNIIQMEAEAKDESVLEIVLDSISLDEARYLLEHLVSLTLSKGYDFTQKDIAYKELTACFEKLQMDSKLSNQLLQQMLVDSGLSMQESAEFDTDELSGENCNSNRSSPIYGLEGTGDQMWAELTYRHKDKSRRKARRRTATPSDLLGTNLSDTSTPPQSPLVAKPTFNIADIIPPAPKGPPPGRGMPHPLIGTIQEEPEDEDFFSPKTQLLRSGSYTVLNSTISNKPHINDTMACPPINLPDGDSSDEDVPSSRGSPSTDFECSKTRSGSYTIISGEIRFDSSQTNTKTTDCTTSRETTPSQEEIIPDRLKQGSITQNASIVGEMIAEFSQPAVNSSGEPGATSHKSNKIPPKVPPKPHRPSSLNPSSPSSTSPITPSPINSQNMSKWKGFISNHLDSEDDQRPITDSKPPLPNSVPVSVEPRDSTGRVIGRRKMAPPNASPALRRKMFNAPTSNTQNNSTRPPAEVLQPSATPPSSPSLRRKQLGSAPDVSDSNNVFMRLTSYSSGSQTAPKRGSMPGLINNSSEKSSSSNQTMTCVKQASGHTKGVLSVCVTEDLLITGSKDQSSKVWDLHLCAELMSLDDHPNYVTRVRYCDNNKLVYSVSNSFIKVWDIRSRGKCIKVLSSSGQVRDSIPHEPSSSSQPFIQSGEQQIFDMWVGGVGDSHSVYSTTGSTVRVWDIRMFNTTMKVASGHQAPIKCLTLHNPPSGLELVTGSKDHFIKLFDLNSDSGGVIQPKHTLSPPHYDGVECLTQRGDALFSGSRDMSIKMWSLSDCSLQQTVNGAHKDWVLDMCLLPDNDILASACRSGTVKLWSSETCSLIDEIRAHTQSVNGLAANSSHLFTASSDNTVGLWKVTSS